MLAAALVERELKPSVRMISDLLQGAWFLEEVRGSGNNDEFLGACQLNEGLLVHLNDGDILTAHDQQGGGGDEREISFG